MSYAVMYGKFSEEKEFGIILTNIYYGGIGKTEEDADSIARECVNKVPGIIIPKVMPMKGRSLKQMSKVFTRYFDDLTDQMYGNEN